MKKKTVFSPPLPEMRKQLPGTREALRLRNTPDSCLA